MKTLRLSKSKGDALAKAGQMTRFLAVLERWCIHQSARGYTIRSEPEPGPGTMVWKAVREPVGDPTTFRGTFTR